MWRHGAVREGPVVGQDPSGAGLYGENYKQKHALWIPDSYGLLLGVEVLTLVVPWGDVMSPILLGRYPSTRGFIFLMR